MKKKSFAKMLALALAMLLMIAALTACGQEAPDTSSPPQESEEPVQEPAVEPTTINFWHHYSAQSAENETLMNVLIPKFEEEHPEYKVNAVSHEWQDLHDKIIISASSDTLPDVARLDIAWVPEFEEMGILVALDEEMTDFADVAAGLLPSAMSTGVVDGHNYALALNTNSKIMFYNAQAFADAGLEPPEITDDMLAAIAAHSGTNENGQQVWGHNEPALAGWNILPYIWSMGGEITNEDYTVATGYLNSEKTVAAVQMLADLYANGQLTGFNSGDIPMTDGFGTGRYMMLLEGPWKTAVMDGAYPDFEYGMCDMPAGEAGSISVLGGEDIAMFDTPNKEGAWEYMKFMTGEWAQEQMAQCGQIAVNTAALESDTVAAQDYAPFLEAITTAKARPPIACWSDFDSALTNAVTDIIVNGADAQSTLDALAAEVDAMLAG